MIDLTHYTRWITASILKHVDARRQDVPLYVEGQEQVPPVSQGFEARIGGPIQRPSGTRQEVCFDVEINILCTTTFDAKDIYHIQKLLGIASQVLNSPILIYKYGDQAVDTQEYIGCLYLMSEIAVAMFGQISSETKLIQGTAEAHYELSL